MALRRGILGEVPQFLKVLFGQLSLVEPGPMPALEQAAIDGWHRRRLSMRTGLTRLWQVGERSELGFDEWMRLDLDCTDHWSLALDFQEPLRMMPAVLAGCGAR